MHVNEAKSFLVQQVAEQAQREGIPLSDLEKRMMQFTESSDAVENPIELNDEFEKHYDTSEFERKIALLLADAYRRLKKETPDTARTWDSCIRKLKKGDHYILVMWSQRSSSTFGFWKTLGASLLVALAVGLVVVLLDHFGIHPSPKGIPTTGTHTSLPTWVQRSILGLMIAGYIYYVASPSRFQRSLATSLCIAMDLGKVSLASFSISVMR